MEETRLDGPLGKVLFATDRSAASRAALLTVAGLSAGAGSRVIVLHVDDRGQPDQARRFVNDVAMGMVALAVDARPEVRQAAPGRVAVEIAAAAAEHDADLVVLGSRGRSDLGGLLLGSVGHEVLQLVRCPVLLVRAGRRAGGRRRRVLVAIAGDENLPELVRTIAAVAEREARVLVLHVLAPAEEAQPGIPYHVVEQVVASLRRCGIRARGRVRAGRRGTAEEIARTALGYGADLIVMGSRRLPALTALLRGSVSHGVVHLSDRPVLVGARANGTIPPR